MGVITKINTNPWFKCILNIYVLHKCICALYIKIFYPFSSDSVQKIPFFNLFHKFVGQYNTLIFTPVLRGISPKTFVYRDSRRSSRKRSLCPSISFKTIHCNPIIDFIASLIPYLLRLMGFGLYQYIFCDDFTFSLITFIIKISLNLFALNERLSDVRSCCIMRYAKHADSVGYIFF